MVAKGFSCASKASISAAVTPFGEQEALQFVAADRLKETVLLGRLDAFRADAQAERPAEMGDGVDEDGGFAGRLHVFQEGAVDLDLVEGESGADRSGLE